MLFQILGRPRPVGADDHQASVGRVGGRLAKAAMSSGRFRRFNTVPTYRTSGVACRTDASWRSAGAGDARPNHLHPSVVDAQRRDAISRARELESVKITDADARQPRARNRRRSRSRGRNHSGCARNETSWMVTANGMPSAERCGVGGGEEDVRPVSANRTAEAASVPTRCPCLRGTTRVSTASFGERISSRRGA